MMCIHSKFDEGAPRACVQEVTNLLAQLLEIVAELGKDQFLHGQVDGLDNP